ncbi:restriction endonuclease subunit S [Desulfonatronum sp. SC1]|uniref:restriction endonuclease subunit S n=1 Tax=Desulfonatronum sp. SC1 TaxID=2109626 RepID=UPI000D30F77D|nr:restriction endonuclease subunit S [Desulfonatronum sp. SC1]PTN38515.1 restriction endonuclease subunit S [Desulfonatronum sp. SC1]
MDGNPYPLPATWTESFIGNVVVKAKQRDPRKKPDKVFQYVDVSAVSNTSFKITGAAPTLGSEAPSRARKAIETDDVLFATVRPTLKRIALVPPELDGAIASTGYCVLRCDKAKAEPGFLYSFLITDHFNARMAGLERGASYPAVRDSDVTASWFPLPPLPEQKKIAHILSTVQRAIVAQERIIQATTELKKALMHKLFTEGLRNEPQKKTEIGPVPESWEVVPLSEVCRFQSGGTPSKKIAEFWQGTIPWVSPKDMKRPRLNDVTDHISQEALEKGSKLAPAGSVFVVVRGMILAKTVPVALAEVPMAINQDMKAIVPGTKLRSDFLLYALEAFRENLFKKVGRSGHGTATLMGHEVAAFKIPLPDLMTQNEIASAIQSLERKKELHEEKRTQLQDLFRTLLHELMTAKTRVHDIDLKIPISSR